MIDLVNITKFYSRSSVAALQDINLTVSPGEIFGIVGLSGAGKSTLIRCINLLERPTAGEVIVAGQNITEMSEPELRNYRRKIGMIFQHFNLLSSRTVLGNVLFPLEIAGVDPKLAKTKVTELLELVDLADKADSYPSQLSGGQKQRVGIARALANNPQVLLCDEATSALDPKTTRSILDLLKDINQRLGLTILLITHEMSVIQRICDRVAVMEHGQIVEIGDVAQVFSNPQATITKEFIGEESDTRAVSA